jgi:hypothetical protein
VAVSHQAAQQLACLVGGNATRDTEDDVAHGLSVILVARNVGGSGRRVVRVRAANGFVVFGIDIAARQLAGVHLAERDREWLLLDGGLDQWPDVVQQALTELGVVGVDLTCPLRGEEDQFVLRVGMGQ